MSTPLETIVAWAKRKWFVYPGSDIYGWLQNSRDYGPYGALLRKNIYDLIIKTFVQQRNDILFMDAALLMNPKVWEASGHVDTFNDPLIDDKKTWERFRADKIIEDFFEEQRNEMIKKLKWKAVYLVIEKSLLPWKYQELWSFWELEIRETDKERWDLTKVFVSKEKEDDFVKFIQENMKKNKIWNRYTDSCWTSNKVIYSDWKVFDVSTAKWCKESKKRWINLWIPAEQVDFDLDAKDMLSIDTKHYIEANILKKTQKEVSSNIPNLIPDSRPTELMHKFIINFLPRNPNTKKDADWTEVRKFSLMLWTELGVIEWEGNKVRMRPETAQWIYVNFKNLRDTTRMRIPFGAIQIGKAFRNEITPGNFIFRTREFEQAEMQYFVEPGTSDKFFKMFEDLYQDFRVNKLWIKAENLRKRDHEKDELAFYASQARDFEYKFSRGWGELQGIHDRWSYDLDNHAKHSGADLQYHDPVSGKRYIPNIVETALGLGRAMFVAMADAYEEEEYTDSNDRAATRTVVRFHPNIAPIKFAILPLIKKDVKQVEIADKLFQKLSSDYMCEYDEQWAIGKRYRRQDEIWTPYCITIDQQSVAELESWTDINDVTVTLRDRDSMEQKRVKFGEVSL